MNTNTLTIVSSFPDQGELHSSQTVGVASYTKTLVMEMARQRPSTKIEVLAEKLPGLESYEENGITVTRTWERNNLWSLTELGIELIRRAGTSVLIEFEINEFGSPLATSWLIFMLLLAKIANLRPTLVMHQVLGDFTELEHKNYSTTLKNICKSILYYIIKLVSYRLIVFEGQLKKSLGGDDKIVVVPHFVTPASITDREQSRAHLGWSADQRYLLCFGYIAPYKGIKELLELWPENLEGTHLIIAGGANPNHVNNPTIQQYIADVEKLAAAKHVTVTGFVPEFEMPHYFAACDAMIFPYRAFMSSSGPLAFAFSYGRPIILSDALGAYASSPDFRRQLAMADLTICDLTFQDDATNLLNVLRRTLEKSEQLVSFSRAMAAARSIDKVAAQTWQVLDQLHLGKEVIAPGPVAAAQLS